VRTAVQGEGGGADHDVALQHVPCICVPFQDSGAAPAMLV
jgi:hypothetical protein